MKDLQEYPAVSLSCTSDSEVVLLGQEMQWQVHKVHSSVSECDCLGI